MLKAIGRTLRLNTLGVSLALASFGSTPAGAYIGGQQTLPGQFPEAITFVEISCTAAKVGPRHILLAAHCLLNGSTRPWDTGDRLTLLSGVTFEKMRKFEVHIRKVSIHPSWIAAFMRNMKLDDVVALKRVVDLAVIELEEPVRIRSGRLRLTPLQAGEQVIVGGFGVDSNYAYGMTYRHKVAIKDMQGRQGNTYRFTHLDAGGNTLSMAAPGDSGGPAFVQGPRGVEIVGVNTFVTGWLELDAQGKVKELVGEPALNVVRLDTPAARNWLLSVLK